MNTKKIIKITGQGIPFRGNDIDTDRILPAHFMKEITFAKMGDYLFSDERFDENGNPKSHPINEPRFKNGTILIVGKNFGCGSSREHAPQAILRYGIKAIIGESFAEIFAGNCKSLGIATVTTTKDNIDQLQTMTEVEPETELTLDIEKQIIVFKEKSMPITIPEARRHSFLNGTWDAVELLKANLPQILEMNNKFKAVKC